MKHLILEFAETPTSQNIDFSVIEYSNELNLNVLKGSKQPAIGFLDEATTTFTKADGETFDSDAESQLSILSDTNTQTREMRESSDSDNWSSKLKMLLDTSTDTFVQTETSDQDPVRRYDLSNLLATRTMTESKETTDSDK